MAYTVDQLNAAPLLGQTTAIQWYGRLQHHPSALAAASSDATNPSRDALARQLIAAEQARLGV